MPKQNFILEFFPQETRELKERHEEKITLIDESTILYFPKIPPIKPNYSDHQCDC